MFISVEDMILDRPVNEVLRELLVLDEKALNKHSLFEGYDFCIYSFGKLIKFSPIDNGLNRSASVECFLKHFSEDELKDYKNFVLCNITFKGVFCDEMYLVSNWYMEYLRLRSNYKTFSKDKHKVVLIVSHLHQKGENGGFVFPHLHVLYNNLESKNRSYYSSYSKEE